MGWDEPGSDPMRDVLDRLQRDFDRGPGMPPRPTFPDPMVEKIALAYRVPYWLIMDAPQPSWFRRPIWRFRALRWRYMR